MQFTVMTIEKYLTLSKFLEQPSIKSNVFFHMTTQPQEQKFWYILDLLGQFRKILRSKLHFFRYQWIFNFILWNTGFFNTSIQNLMLSNSTKCRGLGYDFKLAIEIRHSVINLKTPGKRIFSICKWIIYYIKTLMSAVMSLLFNPFQRSVAFYIEISHLICSANRVTGFCMKCHTGLKWVKLRKHFPFNELLISVFVIAGIIPS